MCIKRTPEADWRQGVLLHQRLHEGLPGAGVLPCQEVLHEVHAVWEVQLHLRQLLRPTSGHTL